MLVPRHAKTTKFNYTIQSSVITRLAQNEHIDYNEEVNADNTYVNTSMSISHCNLSDL